jgi:hypothetical protein
MSQLNHIEINGSTQSLPFTPNGGGNFEWRKISDPEAHAISIKSKLNQAVETFKNSNDTDFVFIQIDSENGFEIDLKKFETGSQRISNAQFVRSINEVGEEKIVHQVTVYLDKVEIPKFLKKIDEYGNKEKNTDKGNPKNAALVANIENIKAASLKSFWQELNYDFPKDYTNVWWEVWVNREIDENVLSIDLITLLNNQDVKIGNRILQFPEHFVFLIKGTTSQLQNSILYYQGLSELRKPLETADFFTNLNVEWQELFLNDLADRIDIKKSNVSVCLLDTGVTKSNDVLKLLIPDRNLETINPSWTVSDSIRAGHGTQMASTILLGDLTSVLQETSTLSIFYQFESIKIIQANHANDPELYGKITIEAVSNAVTLNKDNKRIVCLAVTSDNTHHNGKPSSWSSAIDKLLFGEENEPNETTIAVISAGNIGLDNRLSYPLINEQESIQDPSQAFNALTVGAYTEKDNIDYTNFPTAEILAQRGDLSPSSRTSLSWESNGWPRKPDFVMEGGNDGIFNNGLLDADSLKLLSIKPVDISGNHLSTFGDTSGATALAAKFIAELYFYYPNYWPETIRALTIHSATWTDQMLSHLSKSSNQRKYREEMIKVISKVGYGVPNLAKAKFSAENSLTMILERELTPYKLEKSTIKTNEFHLIDLPWPKETLTQLAEEQVKLTITLSYYIEPNPGNKRYSKSSFYCSHSLRFKMIDKNERISNFKSRVSKALKDETYEKEGAESWVFGNEIRDRGSIHKDIWEGTAADLVTRDKIAIHPIGGWWKDRKKLGRFKNKVRYSLILSIESSNEEIDLYNEVLNKITIDVAI